MITVSKRRVRAVMAAVLAAALVALSPGLGAYQALAAGNSEKGPSGKAHLNPLPPLNPGLSSHSSSSGEPSAPIQLLGATAIPGLLSLNDSKTSPAAITRVGSEAPALSNPPAHGAPPGGVSQASGAEESKVLGGMSKELKPLLDKAAKNSADPRSTGQDIQRIVERSAGVSSGDEVQAPVEASDSIIKEHRLKSRLKAPGTAVFGKPSSAFSGMALTPGAAEEPVKPEDQLPNPRDLYQRAYEEAVEAAKFQGKTAEQVHFGEVAGSMPAGDLQRLQFTFYATGAPEAKTGLPIHVDFSRAYGTAEGRFESLAYADSKEVELPHPLFVRLDSPYYFRRGSIDSPQSALDQVRKAVKELGGLVNFSLKYEQTDDVDLWYRFSDGQGHEAAVNAAHTGEVRVFKAAERAQGSGPAGPSRSRRDYALGAGAAALGILLISSVVSSVFSAVFPAVLVYASVFGAIAGLAAVAFSIERIERGKEGLTFVVKSERWVFFGEVLVLGGLALYIVTLTAAILGVTGFKLPARPGS